MSVPAAVRPTGETGSQGEKIQSLPAWRVILSMVRFRFWYWVVDLFAVVAVRGAMQLMPGLIMRAFFDMLTGKAQAGVNVWTIVAFTASILLMRVFGEYAFYYADVPIFAEINTLLRKNLLVHILKRPGAAALPDSPGEAVSRFRNDVWEIPLFAIWLNDILTGFSLIFIAIGLMVSINPKITLLALIPVLMVGIIANAASSRYEQYRRASRQSTGKVTGFIGEFFGAVQAVKVAGAEKNVIAHFNGLNDERRRMTLRERLFDALLDSIYRNTGSLGTGVVLILAGQAMRTGTFSVGDFALFVLMLQNMSDITTFTGMITARYKQLTVSVERMYRLMEGAPVRALVEHSLVDLNFQWPQYWHRSYRQ